MSLSDLSSDGNSVHDGLNGGPDHCPNTTSLNVNKSLPPKPSNRVRSEPLTICTESPSFTRSPDLRHFSASTNNSLLSRSSMSSKTHFHTLTRELINPDLEDQDRTPRHRSALSKSLDPHKFNPSAALDSSRSTNFPRFSYASVMNSNPFKEDHMSSYFMYGSQGRCSPKVTDFPEPQKRMGLPQSRSEGYISQHDQPARPQNSHYYIPPTLHEVPDDGEVNDENDPIERPARGRSISRSPSPLKILQDIDEDSFLMDQASPRKRSRSPHKKLFGEGGWLSKSTSLKELSREQKRNGFKAWGEKLKNRMEDLTENVIRSYPQASRSDQGRDKSVHQSTFPVSLDPPTQAKLYSEIELMICVTANKFLIQQYEHGRMSPESVSKVTSFWGGKNRPQVIEFQFDQATQRDLILYNLKTFQFYGESAKNPVVLNSTMYNWKTIAKEMSVRTFCNPDSVVKKHMHDTHKVLEMLGAPLVTFLAFQELQVKALATIRETQKKRAERVRRNGMPKEVLIPND